MALAIIWCGFWTTLVLLLGASVELALFIGFASVVGPFLLLALAATIVHWIDLYERRRRRRRL